MTSINHDNNLCLVTHHLPSSTACHCPDHVPPGELDNNFDKILNLKITSNNNPTNILNNLCSGLEKFLGFNSDSKGYDGTGIVYSDLDRLCDGVMGFLSGVLSNIQGHLGQHKDTIEPVIKVLEEKKHAGKEGFNAAIESVVAGVREYNGNVKSSNEAVIEPLQLLLDYTKKNGGELITSINNIQAESHRLDPQLADAVRSCGDRLKEATERSKRCAEFLDPKANNNTKMKKNIYDLNDKLRDKVLHVRKLVEYESQRLASVHKRKDAELKETTEKIKTSFRNLKSCINKQVGDDIDKLVKSLMVRVQKILKKLREISSNLEKYISELGAWIKEAEEFATAALERINKILKHMDGTASTYTMNIKTAAESLGRDVEDLHRAGKNVKDNIADWVTKGTEKAKQLEGWKTAAQSVISEAVKKAKEVHEALDHGQHDALKHELGYNLEEIRKAGEAVGAANNKLQQYVGELEHWNTEATDVVGKADAKCRELFKKLDDTYVTNRMNGTKIRQEAMELERKGKALLNAYNKAHTGLGSLVRNIKEQVNGLKKHIVKDLELLKGQVEKGIETHVKKIINAVLGATEKSNMLEYDSALGLKDLQNGVQLTDAWKKIFEGLDVSLKQNSIATHIEMLLLQLKSKLGGQYNYDTLSEVSGLKKTLTNIIEEFKKASSEPFKDPTTMTRESDEFMTVMHNYHTNIQDKTLLQKMIGNVNGALKDFEKLEAFRDKEQTAQRLTNGAIDDAEKAVKMHVTTIISELKEAAWFIDKSKNNGNTPSGYSGDKNGIKDYMVLLSNGLGDTSNWRSHGTGKVSGLQTITTAIRQLHQDSLNRSITITGGIGNIGIELTNLRNNILLNSDKKDVINRLEDLHDAGFANNETWPDQASTKGLETIKQDITNALSDIQTQVTDNLGILTTFDEAALKQFEAVKENLTQLCEAIKTEGTYGVDNLRALLNTTIKEKLARIKNKLGELQTFDLSAAIRDAENFLTSADPTAQATITSIRGVVSSNVEEAQNDLITQVNKNYVTSVKAILLEFAEKAEKELAPLPKEITDDLDIGYKGFMKKFEKHFVTHEKSIKTIKDINPKPVAQEKSPMSQAAAKFFGSLNRFLHDLEKQPDFKTDYEKIKPTRDALAKLFGDLVTSEYFNHEFSRNLSALKVTLSELKPSLYGEGNTPSLLNALKNGFTTSATELNNAYISTYDSERFGAELVEKDKLTAYGTKLSKVC
ncbi:hypothetical protein, conserved, partial [Babesia bigemina]